MPELITRDFTMFTKEKIKPAIDAVIICKRNCLCLAIGVGLAVCLIFAIVVYLFFAPHRDTMSEYGINYWALMYVAPAALGMIGFSLAYILTLRRTLNEFHKSLLDKLAEFIDPAIILEPGKTLSDEELGGSILATIRGKSFPGADRFRCRIPGATAHFSYLRMRKGNSGPNENGEMLKGLYFHAVMEWKFAMPIMILPSSVEFDIGGFETEFRAGGDTVGAALLQLDDPLLGRRIIVPAGGEALVLRLLSASAFTKLEALRRRDGVGFYLSCQGDCLRVALLSPARRVDSPGELDGFDFERWREFCRDARLCLDLTLGMTKRNDLWLERKAAIGM